VPHFDANVYVRKRDYRGEGTPVTIIVDTGSGAGAIRERKCIGRESLLKIHPDDNMQRLVLVDEVAEAISSAAKPPGLGRRKELGQSSAAAAWDPSPPVL
jgi:hypothetical protein